MMCPIDATPRSSRDGVRPGRVGRDSLGPDVD
jgi:hypothetical protein